MNSVNDFGRTCDCDDSFRFARVSTFVDEDVREVTWFDPGRYQSDGTINQLELDNVALMFD